MYHLLIFNNSFVDKSKTVNNWRVVICRGNCLKKLWKSAEAFFWISPEADRRSAEGDIQKKASADFQSFWRQLPRQITTHQLFTVTSRQAW